VQGSLDACFDRGGWCGHILSGDRTSAAGSVQPAMSDFYQGLIAESLSDMGALARNRATALSDPVKLENSSTKLFCRIFASMSIYRNDAMS